MQKLSIRDGGHTEHLLHGVLLWNKQVFCGLPLFLSISGEESKLAGGQKSLSEKAESLLKNIQNIPAKAPSLPCIAPLKQDTFTGTLGSNYGKEPLSSKRTGGISQTLPMLSSIDLSKMELRAIERKESWKALQQKKEQEKRAKEVLLRVIVLIIVQKEELLAQKQKKQQEEAAIRRTIAQQKKFEQDLRNAVRVF